MQDKQYTISPKKVESVQTGVANWLYAFAIIIFCAGFIAGIYLGNDLGGYDFSWGVAFLAWFFAAIEGSLLLALREILIVMRTHQVQQYTIALTTVEPSAEESTDAEPQQPSASDPTVQPEASANP